MDPIGQYVPAAHTEIVLVVGQTMPAGQELSVIDPAGQKLPEVHGNLSDGVGQ